MAFRPLRLLLLVCEAWTRPVRALEAERIKAYAYRVAEERRRAPAARDAGAPPWHPGLPGWLFVRCGLRGARAAERLAADLRRRDYVDPPRTFEWPAFAQDGGRGLYLMAPPSVVRRERLERARRTTLALALTGASSPLEVS